MVETQNGVDIGLEEKVVPPRAWTHPCKCTLVAHEQCLLKWIQTSQGTSGRAANALKCPQCGAKYELESKYPVLLRFLAAGNKMLQQLGRLFTLFGVATFVVVVGSGTWPVARSLVDLSKFILLYRRICYLHWIWRMGAAQIYRKRVRSAYSTLIHESTYNALGCSTFF